MELSKILSKCDHTLLKPEAVWEDIKEICDDGIEYGCASVCIPPSFVKAAKEYVKDKIKICTVIGFPNGYSTTEVKCFEAASAVDHGADEIDMVANIGLIKAGRFDEVTDEIGQVRHFCQGKILKVIVETCLLTDEEKIEMCRVCKAGGADYIKTSTGFSAGGATFSDVEILCRNAPEGLLVKASGGISSLEDASRYIAIGAERLGTSRIVKIAKSL